MGKKNTKGKQNMEWGLTLVKCTMGSKPPWVHSISFPVSTRRCSQVGPLGLTLKAILTYWGQTGVDPGKLIEGTHGKTVSHLLKNNSYIWL